MKQPWPFRDPENLVTFTVVDVLSGRRPVLYASHDVSDGGWQFLPDEAVEIDDAKLVALSDIFALDPSVAEVADLPLGWSAERAAVGAPWAKTPAFPSDWAELVEEAERFTNDCQERLERDFDLAEWESYRYDQEDASFVFLDDDNEPGLTARMQIVGSLSESSKTWLWAWENSSLLPTATEYVHLLQQFGEQNGFERLARAKWPADDEAGWQMACVACFLLDGEGVYAASDDGGTTFMVLTNPTPA